MGNYVGIISEAQSSLGVTVRVDPKPDMFENYWLKIIILLPAVPGIKMPDDILLQLTMALMKSNCFV